MPERGTDRIHICPRCGELSDDYGPQSYCRPCWREYSREYNARRRRARLGGSLAEIGTARPDRLRMLADSLVDRFGGFDRAAAEIVAYVRKLAESGRAPAQAMKAYLAIVKLLHAASRPE